MCGQRGADAILALCNHCESAEEETLLSLRAAIALLCGACDWVASPNVDVRRIITRLVQSILQACRRVEPVLKVKAVGIVMTTILEWSQRMDTADSPVDPTHIRVSIQAALQGVAASAALLNQPEKAALVEKSCEFLDGSAFDIRLLLADAPADFRLEEVVKDHFAPTLYLLSALKQTELCNERQMSTERLGLICEDYLQCLAAYLINSVSSEPFLCGLVQIVLVLTITRPFNLPRSSIPT